MSLKHWGIVGVEHQSVPTFRGWSYTIRQSSFEVHSGTRKQNGPGLQVSMDLDISAAKYIDVFHIMSKLLFLHILPINVSYF